MFPYINILTNKLKISNTNMFPFQNQHVSSIPQPKPTKSDPKQVAKFIGVRQRQSGRWVAEIKGTSKTTQKIRMWLGTFKTAEEAARAYDEAACLLRGSNTRTNFPNTTTTPLGASDSPLASRIRSLLERRKQKADQTQMNNNPISRTLPLSTDQTVDPIFPKELLVEPSELVEYSYPNHVPITTMVAETSPISAMNRQDTRLDELFYGEDCSNSSGVDLHEYFPSFQHLFFNT